MLAASWIHRFIGDSGASVVSRVMGLILAFAGMVGAGMADSSGVTFHPPGATDDESLADDCVAMRNQGRGGGGGRVQALFEVPAGVGAGESCLERGLDYRHADPAAGGGGWVSRA